MEVKEKVEFSNNTSDYELKKTLGQGSQGNVYLVEYRPNKTKYALKVLNKSFFKNKQEVLRLKSEIEVQKLLSDLPHP